MLLQGEVERMESTATLGQILVQHHLPQFDLNHPLPGCLWQTTPTLDSIWDMEKPNSTLDQQLKERDVILGALKEHLKLAQERMKKQADLKRKDEFQEGDYVFLKIRPYRQVSLRNEIKSCHQSTSGHTIYWKDWGGCL